MRRFNGSEDTLWYDASVASTCLARLDGPPRQLAGELHAVVRELATAPGLPRAT